MMRILPLLFVLTVFIACSSPETNSGMRTEGRAPGECSDGADNDGDGDFDCDDEDCVGAPACNSTTDMGSSNNGSSDASTDDTGDSADMSVELCLCDITQQICDPGCACDLVCDLCIDCGERQCGSDGCGGMCGAGCTGDESCSAAGECVACACDTSDICDVGCEDCDPDCCVESHPTSVVDVSAIALLSEEQNIGRAGGSSLLITGYEAKLTIDSIVGGGVDILAWTVTDNCVIDPTPPAACNSVDVRLEDGVREGIHDLTIRTFEDVPSEACAMWLEDVVNSGFFDVICTPDAAGDYVIFESECNLGARDRVPITNSWTLEVAR